MKDSNTQVDRFVELPIAIDAISNWLTVAALAFPGIPDNGLLRAFSIPIGDIDELYSIAQINGAKYVRAYLSIKDRQNPAATAGLMLVPVDIDGNDIIFPQESIEGETNIRDFTQPCPAFCSWSLPTSPLMVPVLANNHDGE